MQSRYCHSVPRNVPIDLYLSSKTLLGYIQNHNKNSNFTGSRPAFAVIRGAAFLCTTSSDNSSQVFSDSCHERDSLINASDVDKLYKTLVENSSDQRLEVALAQTNIALTTDLVDEVLQKLRFEEKLAFRFFTWVGHQEGYRHQWQTYNAMIDILSSTRYKAKQFAIICDMLDYMKRNGRNAVPLDVLLTILSNYTDKHLTRLPKFANKKKRRVKTQPETNAFNLLLDSLCKCNLVNEAEILFNKAKCKIFSDSNTYNILFFGWCRSRNPKKAVRVLEDMIGVGHIPDNFTYNAAIDSFCELGMLTEALELFNFMRVGTTVSAPTAKTYCIVIVALAKMDRMKECFEFLSDMRNSGCLPDVSTYKEMIEGMCLAGKLDDAYKLLEEMGSKGYPPDIVTYNCLMKVFCDLKKVNEAMHLFNRMINVGCEPSVHTYNMLISMFFSIDEPDGAFETWHEMDKRNCAQNVDTYGLMIEGLFDASRVEDACYLLEDVLRKGMKLPYQMFDGFLMRLSLLGDLSFINRLSEHMRRFYNPAMARRFAISQKRKSMSLRRK